AGQVRVIELVRVADALIGHQLEELAAEGVAATRGKVGERHLVAAAHLGIHLVDLAGKAVRRQPLVHGIRVDEGLVDARGRTSEDTVEADGAGHGGSFRWLKAGWHSLVERAGGISTLWPPENFRTDGCNLRVKSLSGSDESALSVRRSWRWRERPLHNTT